MTLQNVDKAKNAQSHAALHNAGVTAAENGQWKQAETLFSAAMPVCVASQNGQANVMG